MSSCSVAWLLAGDRGTARERGEARRGIARFLGFTPLTLERKREREGGRNPDQPIAWQ